MAEELSKSFVRLYRKAREAEQISVSQIKIKEINPWD